MDKLVIERSRPLTGTLTVNGAKNSVLPIMAACLLTDEPSVIEHVPMVTDVMTMLDILRQLGVQVAYAGSELRIHPDGFRGYVAPYELVSRMRASICLLGPLLARQGRASVSLPGGCVIGPRPVDLHLKGLQALGASIEIEHGYIMAECGRLKGSRIHLGGDRGSSVLATGNVMMAAALADGVSMIEHAACEPEVVDLADFLVSMGARIEGQGGSTIRVEGVERLHGSSRYRIISDRIEAGTLAMAAAMTGGSVTLEGARSDHLEAVIEKLREAGVQITVEPGRLRVKAADHLRAVNVTSLPYPGFPTDLQAQIMALLCLADGVSVITEKIYPERFLHVPELNRMGAAITREGATAVVKGMGQLSGAQVVASDLRASAALVLAGLAASTQTEVRGLEHLDRGYQNIETQLRQLGAHLVRVPEEQTVAPQPQETVVAQANGVPAPGQRNRRAKRYTRAERKQ